CVGLLLLVLNGVAQQTDKPFAYWSFDGNQPYLDLIGKKQLLNLNKNCKPTVNPGAEGKGLYMDRGADCRVQLNALNGNIGDQFTISFYFRGAGFNYSSYPQGTIIASLRYPNLRF